MRICVFGIGYVGAVSAACLARDGHDVRAVDVSPGKVKDLNAGLSPIVEPGLDRLIAEGVARSRLRASADARAAVAESELVLICVGTPSRANGAPDMSYVEKVAADIGAALKADAGFRSVVVRSTLPPGAMDAVVRPALECASGLKAGDHFGLGYYPEFLRESTAVSDYDNPGAAVFASLDEPTTERLKALQPALPAPPQRVPMGEAEAVKYASNAWHALKVSFANEMGDLFSDLGLDSHRVLERLCADTRLNMSAAYMRPGFAFGGSCLPKDLRAVRAKAREIDCATPLLDAVTAVNAAQIERAFRMVEAAGSRDVSLFGLSFKPGTDDLRESPFVILAERLIGRGYRLRIFDPTIRLSRLTGSNLAYVTDQLPHIATLLAEEIEPVIGHGSTFVLADPVSGAAAFHAAGHRAVIDLIRVHPGLRTGGAYRGLCW